MTPTQTKPGAENAVKPAPGFWEQVVMTIKVLLASGAVLGGIWLLDSIVAN